MPAIEFSSVIESPVEQVWHLLKDFEATSQLRAEVESDASDLRCRAGQYEREVKFSDGSHSIERMLKACDHEMRVSFRSVDETFRYGTYRVFVQVYPTTRRGACAVFWLCYYAPQRPGEEEPMQHILQSYIAESHQRLCSYITRTGQRTHPRVASAKNG